MYILYCLLAFCRPDGRELCQPASEQHIPANCTAEEQGRALVRVTELHPKSSDFLRCFDCQGTWVLQKGIMELYRIWYALDKVLNLPRCQTPTRTSYVVVSCWEGLKHLAGGLSL
jgi:hypothetical protein